MPCLLVILGYFFPRLAIALLYLFTGWFRSAFDGLLWVVLGFIFLPLTTVWYGISEAFFGDTAQTVGLVIAVLMDLGIVGGSARKRKR